MAASSRTTREAKRRIQQMEAKRELRKNQAARRKRDNTIAVAGGVGALALAVILGFTAFANNPTEAEFAAAENGLTETPAPAVSLPPVPSPDVAAGKTLTGDLVLNGSSMAVELDGDKAPQAASVLKTLSDAGFYNGLSCHRLTTGDSFGVLQCGSQSGNGAGTPEFSWGPIENAPANNIYPAGTIAMARAGDANSNGTQFFVTYKDTTIPADAAGGYAVVGRVTNGLDVVQSIADAGLAPAADGSQGEDGAPAQPVTIDSFTLS